MSDLAKDLQQQLAAERLKVDKAVEFLTSLRDNQSCDGGELLELLRVLAGGDE